MNPAAPPEISTSRYTREEVGDEPDDLGWGRPKARLDGEASDHGCGLEQQHHYRSGS
jgi:hypothetical protein